MSGKWSKEKYQKLATLLSTYKNIMDSDIYNDDERAKMIRELTTELNKLKDTEDGKKFVESLPDDLFTI